MRFANLCSVVVLMSASFSGACITTKELQNAEGTNSLKTDDGGSSQGDASHSDTIDGGGKGSGPDGAVSDGDSGSIYSFGCALYCKTIEEACLGIHAQYLSREQCMNMCADTPLGLESDVSGDTVGCRLYHARIVTMMNNPVDHCPHAGPTGGGTCGARCEVLCERSESLCNEDRGYPRAYSSKEDCLQACTPTETEPGFAVDPIELPLTGDTVNCRIYHLRAAYTEILPNGTGTPVEHCPHAGLLSETCN